ncbi:uncharacterized protein LOC130767551 [Actinidia eriantha]|uniref:uncharacterized protein LOC130767551 n=1 Tax=Actinidia eriantha TaxID=165200 RepID=UPI0025885562|nr:uncharacterized protein LOC130767551 [Actinidia eriantha]
MVWWCSGVGKAVVELVVLVAVMELVSATTVVVMVLCEGGTDGSSCNVGRRGYDRGGRPRCGGGSGDNGRGGGGGDSGDGGGIGAGGVGGCGVGGGGNGRVAVLVVELTATTVVVELVVVWRQGRSVVVVVEVVRGNGSRDSHVSCSGGGGGSGGGSGSGGVSGGGRVGGGGGGVGSRVGACSGSGGVSGGGGGVGSRVGACSGGGGIDSSLARRELQALCKKNKIPANLTTSPWPMLSKLLRLSKGSKISQKPCESEIAVICCVAGEDMIETRLSTRRTVPGDVENAKLDVPETLAMPRGRKRAPVASAVRKIEAQLKEEDEDKNNVVASARRKMETPLREEISVQKAYSTRRSTRLLVKKMTESDLNNKEGIEPECIQQMINAKNDDLEAVSDEMSKDLERNVKADSDDLDKSLEVKGTNQQIIAGDLLLKTDDLEAIADEKSNVLSENMIKIHRMDYEKYGKSHILSGENLEKSLGLKDEIPEEEACNSANQLINGEGHVKTNGNIYRVRERNEKSISKLGKVALHGVAPEGVDGGVAQLLSENK